MRQSNHGRGRGIHGDWNERFAFVVSLNDRVAAAAVRHHFDNAGTRVPFQCECGSPECSELVLRSVAEYEAAREDREQLLAAGHAR